MPKVYCDNDYCVWYEKPGKDMSGICTKDEVEISSQNVMNIDPWNVDCYAFEKKEEENESD